MDAGEWFGLLHGVEGWLGDDEALLLYRLARRCAGAGVIVEIGSWKGRSTICLALGSLAGKKGPVHAIDPHDFAPDASVMNDGLYRTSALTTFGEFSANLKRAGVIEIVHPIVATSDEAARNWTQPIELLWIDGAHTYENDSRDIQNWSPYIVPGG